MSGPVRAAGPPAARPEGTARTARSRADRRRSARGLPTGRAPLDRRRPRAGRSSAGTTPMPSSSSSAWQLRQRSAVAGTGASSEIRSTSFGPKPAGFGTLPSRQVAEASQGRFPQPLSMWSGGDPLDGEDFTFESRDGATATCMSQRRALASAPLELGLDIGRIEPARGERDVGREPEVGELRDEALVVLGGHSQGGLDALLAELLRARPRPAVEEARDVRALRARRRARSRTRRQSHGAKHETRARVARGPGGRTRSRSASPSQSSRSSSTASVLPEVSPFRQSRPRERLQKCASPVSRVSRSASSSIQASMSTRPQSASWTIAARSSGGIAKRHSQTAKLVSERSRGVPGPRGGSRRGAQPARPRAPSATCAAVAGAARRDHRDRDRGGDRRRQREVVAVRVPSASIEVSRISPAPRSCALARPRGRRAAGRDRARVRADVASGRVDREHDRLRAELLGELGQELGPRERGRVDRRPCRRPASRSASASPTVRMPPPTVKGIASRSATRRTRPTKGLAPLDRRLDVEEDELVGSRVRVRRPELDRIADLAQTLEADALDDAAAGDVEAGDQARERHRSEVAGAGAAALLGVELHADEAAVLAQRRRGPPSWPSRRASPPRTSARSRTPRRPDRRAPSRCGERGPGGAVRRGPAGGQARGRRRPLPTTRGPAAGPGRSRASVFPRRPAGEAPRRVRGRRDLSWRSAPTPRLGERRDRRAPPPRGRSSHGRRPPARSQARTTERTLPAP